MATIDFVTTRNQGAIIDVKFGFTPNVLSLSTANFELWTTGTTPAQIADPFRDFDPYADYNSTSRTMTLYVNANAELESDTTYLLKAHGLKNTLNANQPDDQEEFTTGAFVQPEEPTPDVIEIEDHSVKPVVVVDSGDTEFTFSGALFNVQSTDPENGAFGVPSDYGDGRITITFNEAVAFAFVNTNYFKGQRKYVSSGYNRWEDLVVQVEQDADPTVVYVNFPSTDATPVYGEEGPVYFEPGYKYRVKISESVATYDS